MTKEEAIKIVGEFILKKKLNLEVIYHVDKDPIEDSKFWLFKNYWEPRESIRGDIVRVDWSRPKIIVIKESGIVNELTIEEFEKIKNTLE